MLCILSGLGYGSGASDSKDTRAVIKDVAYSNGVSYITHSLNNDRSYQENHTKRSKLPAVEQL
jgi:hypothetical protein